MASVRGDTTWWIPLDVATEGDIGIAGSSTVFPLSVAVITQWQDEGGTRLLHRPGRVGWRVRAVLCGRLHPTSPTPHERSRTPRSSPVAAIGREPIEIRVGSDALTAVVSKGNDVRHRLDARAARGCLLAARRFHVGRGRSELPASSASRRSHPGADSGTFDYFNEVVFDEAEPSPILSSGAQIVGEDDNVTVRGVADDGCTAGDTSTTCAIGFFGFAFFQANAGELTAVSVEGIAPGEGTVNDGSYPIARPLFMYTDADVVAEKPRGGPVHPVLPPERQRLSSGTSGYFPAPDGDLQGAADTIAGAPSASR